MPPAKALRWTRLAAVFLLATSGLALAEIRRTPIEYRQADTLLEGVLVYDTATTATGKRPGIVVVHQWRGLGDYELKRAEMLAKLGYVAFCADIYGKGVRPATVPEASKLAGTYKDDRPLLRARVNAAFETLLRQPQVDPARTAAIGYCFGGTTALELARSGTAVGAVVSFHGGLAAPAPANPRTLKARVLALHGADDPFVPPAEVQAFEKEMREAGADWQLVSYGGAVHSFTDWNAGTDNSRGAAYNERADRRSWEAMKAFFAELFR